VGPERNSRTGDFACERGPPRFTHRGGWDATGAETAEVNGKLDMLVRRPVTTDRPRRVRSRNSVPVWTQCGLMSFRRCRRFWPGAS